MVTLMKCAGPSASCAIVFDKLLISGLSKHPQHRICAIVTKIVLIPIYFYSHTPPQTKYLMLISVKQVALNCSLEMPVRRPFKHTMVGQNRPGSGAFCGVYRAVPGVQ